MKTKIAATLFLLVFLGAVWFIANKFIAVQNAIDQPKTQKELQKIDFYKKYNKSLGQSFTTDSLAIVVESYDFVCDDSKTTLYCTLSFTNNSSQNKLLKEHDFELINDSDTVFLPKKVYRSLESNATKQQVLIYELPARKLPYLAYWLRFESQTNKTEKAIISISKSYRSEG